MHVLPDNPHILALGEERLVNSDQTISWHNVRYSTPDGHQGRRVWCRVSGEELVIVARTTTGLSEVARHGLSTPGNPRIVDEHYPHHPDGSMLRTPKPKPRTEAEIDFLMLGDGANAWLTEAAATGVARIRRKMGQAVELARVLGPDRVDRALTVAAAAGRFDDGDLVSILDHLDRGTDADESNVVAIDEAHSAQPGTGPWRRLGA